MRMTGIELQQATNGTWHGEPPAMISGIGTDSRDFTPGHAFLALRGPNFDGHRYADTIATQAAALIGDRHGISLWGGVERPVLEVSDTLQALGDIAAAWRTRLHDTSVIAVSGSYGKTTVRTMLAHCFGKMGKVVAATRANLNNLIGVPATLLSIPEVCDLAIIECGISERDEMDRLGRIVRPDVVVLTGLSAAHGEGLGGLAGIAAEKAALLRYLCDDGWAALGEGVRPTLLQYGQTIPASAFSQGDNDEHVVRWQLQGTQLTLTCGEERVLLTLPLPARHWAANMALCASVIRNWFRLHDEAVTLAAIAGALADWQTPGGRMHQLSGRNDSLVLDDCYNANPASMQAALDTLAELDGRRIAILGDMAELGADAAAQHAAMDVDGIDELWLIGPNMQHLAQRHPAAHWFPTTSAAEAGLKGLSLTADDRILVKASRSMRLESIVRLLTAEENAHAV